MKVRSFSGNAAFIPVLAAFLSVSAAPSHAATDPAVACAIAKHKAAAKKLSSKVKCHAKALKAGVAADTACLAQAEAKFVAAFAKAQSKGGCLSVDDTDDVETLIDDTLDALLARVPATTTTTTTTTLPPPRCCTLTSSCSVLTPEGCEEFLGTLGGATDVCDGATGTCQATGSPGNCCSVSGTCFGGPSVDEGSCLAVGGFFSSSANCVAGGCAP